MPRYSPRPLPPYSYVPGATPHPVSDPRGHLYGQPLATSPPLDPADWAASSTYRYAVDLFNHGYYWEAHEAWESLWHAAGRTGPVALWLKALIKLAAAAVKLREGNAHGAARHAERALALLNELPTTDAYCGLNIPDVKQLAADARVASLQTLQPDPARRLDQRLHLAIH